MLFALTVSLFVQFPAADAAVDDCRECSPKGAVERAEKLVNALRPRLPRSAQPGVFGLLGAHERRLRGDLEGARVLLLHASASCFGGDDASCGDAYAALADVTALRSGGEDPLAEAFLSLVDTRRVPSALCSEAIELRFALKARARPWTAKSTWADQCGPSTSDALAYHAARTAIVRGEFSEARARIRHLRLHAPGRALRAAYLDGVLAVGQGKLKEAAERFVAIASLPPSATRSEAEDDARNLAALQLARVKRELGDPAGALEWYQRVAAETPARREALTEAAVVAAHIGQLGTAARYLDALDAHYPDSGSAVERQRIRANLQALRGDEGDARATFASLSNSGRVLRTKLGDKAQVLSLLREDPSLSGLLDPNLARGFFVLEEELSTVSLELSQLREQIAALDVTRRDTPELKDLKRADAYLARAERDIGIADTETQIRAAELRAIIDDMVARTTGIEDTLHQRRERSHREIAEELALAERDLLEVKARAEREMADLSQRLYARALEVVEGLEMSEDIGAIEMAWQRKVKVSAEARRIREEYDEGIATLRGDTGVTSVSDLHKDDEVEPLPEERNEFSGPIEGLEKGQPGQGEEGGESEGAEEGSS